MSRRSATGSGTCSITSKAVTTGYDPCDRARPDPQSGQVRSRIGVVVTGRNLLEEIQRPLLRLLEDAREILADDADEHELDAADDHQRADERSPPSHEVVHRHVSQQDVDEV